MRFTLLHSISCLFRIVLKRVINPWPLWVEAIASICKGVFEATGQMQGLGLHTARWQDGARILGRLRLEAHG